MNFSQITIRHSDVTTISLQTSILPPPFLITVRPTLSSGRTSIIGPIVTRTIRPPPVSESERISSTRRPGLTSSPIQSPTTTRPPGTTRPSPVTVQSATSLTVAPGPPSPRCKRNCGSPCSWPWPCGLGGFGWGGWGGGADGEPPTGEGGNPEQCTTTTVSTCTEVCTSRISRCDTSCSTVMKCTATSSSTRSNVEFAPIFVGSWEQWPATLPPSYEPPSDEPGPSNTQSRTRSWPFGHVSTTIPGFGYDSPVPTKPTRFDPTDLPSLPSETDPAYSGPGCASYSSTRICNGSGERAACIDKKLCVPSKVPCPPWKTIGSPMCGPETPICLKPTQYTRCASMVGRAQTSGGRPKSTGIDAKTTDTSPAKSRPTVRYKEIAVKVITATAIAANDTFILEPEHILERREDIPIGCGGSTTGGCDVINSCAQCAFGAKRSCMRATLVLDMQPIDTEAKLMIFENDTPVCSRSIKCRTADGFGCLEKAAQGEMTCPNGDKIQSWSQNLAVVKYVSKGAWPPYVLNLGQKGPDDYSLCNVLGRLPALCVKAGWFATDGYCPG